MSHNNIRASIATQARKEGVPLIDKAAPGLPIEAVDPDGLGAKLDLQAGDRIFAVNGEPIRDPIDFRFHFTEEEVRIEVQRDNTPLVFDVTKDPDDDLGVTFAEMGILRCNNACVFCFLHQMPKGLRKTLYYQDDDFRLSFLHGAYVTLTNLDEQEFLRIVEQRLTPMYVSVHATDPVVRGRLLGRSEPVGVLEDIDRLIDAGIEVHTQIVLCPGINDGLELKRSLYDLAERHPQVASVGIVPLGLTQHRRNLVDLDPVTPEVATRLLDKIAYYQSVFARKLGTRFAYAGDEFYLLAGREVPVADAYDGFPLLENGVGMVRRFLDDFETGWAELESTAAKTDRGVALHLVTSTIGPGILGNAVERLNAIPGIRARLTAVENRFLGPRITVSGLLAGEDIIEALRSEGVDADARVLLPPNCVNHDGILLDGIRPDDISATLEVPVSVGQYSLIDTVRACLGDGEGRATESEGAAGHPYIASHQFFGSGNA